MHARSVCLVTLSLSEAGPGRFGCQVSVTDIYHAIPYPTPFRVRFSGGGTYACPQCLPSDIVPIRSWTRTLRWPGIRHRIYHTIPYHAIPYSYDSLSSGTGV